MKNTKAHILRPNAINFPSFSMVQIEGREIFSIIISIILIVKSKVAKIKNNNDPIFLSFILSLISYYEILIFDLKTFSHYFTKKLRILKANEIGFKLNFFILSIFISSSFEILQLKTSIFSFKCSFVLALGIGIAPF